ncbi:MAG TPA: TonB-dependent receptor, partial [Bacteroidia bacterium]|nr:TonB-dependent receptor [Bacteroidia bacterium]
THSVSGTVTDTTGTIDLVGATVMIFHPGDTIAITGCSADTSGHFVISGLPDGKYKMKFLFPGYAEGKKFLMIAGADVDLGKIPLKNEGLLMTEALIKDIQVRVTQNGDTTVYNANAFKTNPDATAEDLLLKMPGVTNDGTGTKVQGDDIKQVMVDGKPFFGDDPNAALKNIPADMVDQIQVYDQASDQSRLTGFDDGNARKTINIITKQKAMHGSFGKIHGGAGTDSRYDAGLTFNRFDGLRRFTVLGMSNNINLQNFSMQDIMGTMGGSGGGGHMMMRGGGGGMYGRSNNFTVAQMGGISTTHAFGLNFSDQFGEKIKFSGSYFFNYSENENQTVLTRNYFTTNDTSLVYNDSSNTSTRNVNHRFSLKFEYQIDSMNSIIYTPKFTSQFTHYSRFDQGANLLGENITQSSSLSELVSDNLGYTLSQTLDYKHKFKKEGRTLVLDVSNSINNRDGTGSFYSQNTYYPSSNTVLDQNSNGNTRSNTITPTVSWTEPINTKSYLLFSASASIADNKQLKQTFNNNMIEEQIIDSALSNTYRSTYQYKRGGVSYKYSTDKASFSCGTDYQYATLIGKETFPYTVNSDHVFQSVLPNALFSYKFSKTSNLKIVYRTSTVSPTILQLQDVVDNSSPLQLKTGNPLLSQDYEHTFITHYGTMDPASGKGFFVFAYGSIAQNYIGNSTYIASRDTTIDHVFLNRGTQLTLPVNLKGYKTGRVYLTYSIPLTKLKMNLGINASGSITHTPGLINDIQNNNDNLNFGPGLTLSSNISDAIDFTLAYSGTYNINNNSLPSQVNSSYFTHTATFKTTITLKKKFVMNTSLDQYFYTGLGQGYNTNYLLWNAYIGYKFLKDNSLEAKISATDILKQNVSISRTVTEAYIEDSRTSVLQQYFMFTLTYTLKKFKGMGDSSTTGSDANQTWGH